MSLSVCCPTADPGPRVHAILRGLRAVADEVVVAADVRCSAQDIAWYADVADQISTFEFTNVERVYAWLHAQCSCDWILLVEGDECASPELIERLPELTRQRAISQFYVPRRWLFPDPGHWLDEAPWWPDLSNRLVRNDGALFFPGTDHTDALRSDPAGFLECPIYHLAALAPLEHRQAKIARYQRTTSHLRIGGVRPVSETYYLPEHTSRRAPVPIPARDRDAVNALVDGSPGPPPSGRAIPHVPLVETDRFYAGRPFSSDGYRSQLELLERNLSFAPGEQRALLARLSNSGTEIWPWGLERAPHLHLSYERWEPRLGQWSESNVITPLPHSVQPGASAIVPVTVVAPDDPGAHRLRIDLRHAGHAGSGPHSRSRSRSVDQRETCAASERRRQELDAADREVGQRVVRDLRRDVDRLGEELHLGDSHVREQQRAL
jgi:hypothetical protein